MAFEVFRHSLSCIATLSLAIPTPYIEVETRNEHAQGNLFHEICEAVRDQRRSELCQLFKEALKKRTCTSEQQHKKVLNRCVCVCVCVYVMEPSGESEKR